jgi:hypothetical protein
MSNENQFLAREGTPDPTTGLYKLAFNTPAGFASLAPTKEVVNAIIDYLGALPVPSVWPASDAVFDVVHDTDPTRFFKIDLTNQATGTGVTIYPSATVSRPFRLPDISGRALVEEDGTGKVFCGGTVQPASNAGIQFATTVANRAQFRGNQFGANNAGAGLTTFKSRGPINGTQPYTGGGLLAGDVMGSWTVIGVAPNDNDIPLAASLQFLIPSSFVPAGQNYVPSEMVVGLVALAGPINSKRNVFRLTSEGVAETLRGVRAGGAATAPTALQTGALWSSGTGDPNGSVTGSPGDLFSRQDGGAGTCFYVKESGVGTNTGWVSK